MLPTLIDVPLPRLPFLGPLHLHVPAYGFFLLLAIIVGRTWFIVTAARNGFPRAAARRAFDVALVLGLLGAKAGGIVSAAIGDPAHLGQLTSWEALRGGGVVGVGIAVATITLIAAARLQGLNGATYVDIAAIPLVVAQAIGRVGCLSAGCCYGTPTSLPWALSYASMEAHLKTGVPLGVPLHPTPVYDALWWTVVVLPILLLIRHAQLHPWALTLVYYCGGSLGRAVIEMTRGDTGMVSTVAGRLSINQLAAVVVCTVAGILWLAVWRRQRTDPNRMRWRPTDE